MEPQTFDACFTWIEKFHGKRGAIDAQVRVEWLKTFANEHDEVFCEAAQYATQKLAPGRFPTIERMTGFVAEAREKLWQKVKAAEPKKPIKKLAESRAPRSEYAQEILKAAIAMLEHKQDPVETFLDLDKHYPGRGWDRAAHDQRQHQKRMTETQLPAFLEKRLSPGAGAEDYDRKLSTASPYAGSRRR